VHVDPLWKSVKKFAYDELGTQPDQPCFFDHFDDEQVERILKEQRAVVAKVKGVEAEQGVARALSAGVARA